MTMNALYINEINQYYFSVTLKFALINAFSFFIYATAIINDQWKVIKLQSHRPKHITC